MLVERRKSPIHGNGVFARQPIEEGDWQYIYGEGMPLMSHPMEHYCFEGDEGEMYLPYAPWCWMNSSKDPNCDVEWDEDGWTIVALRDIEPDEELTMEYDYGQ